MSDQQDKDLLALYRRSRQEEPSQLTDMRIRQAAQKAMAARSRKDRRWLWGLSTAAVLVLSFSVVLQVWMVQDSPLVIQKDSVSTSEHMPTPNFLPTPEPPPGGASEAGDRRLENLPAMPMSAAPMPEKTVAKEEPMLQEDQAEIAVDREAFRKKAPAHSLQQSAPEPRLPDAVVIPRLPASVEAFQAMAPRLVVEKSASGLIAVYTANKLILSVQHQPDGLVFKAWPGSEVLGIKLNWQLNPMQLSGCIDDSVYQQCQLQQDVYAHFEGVRLDFIQWNQQ